jgi:hypothetical protein
MVKMKKFAPAVLLLATAMPMAPASAADALAAELQPFASLAGSCWRGPAPGGQGVDTHCFTAALGGHFLRDRHHVTPGDYMGETLYRWDSGTRNIRWDYYASDGLLMSGSASGTNGGIGFEVGSVSPAGASPIGARIAWRRDGPDAYVVTMLVRENGDWRPGPGAARFERIGHAPAD